MRQPYKSLGLVDVTLRNAEPTGDARYNKLPAQALPSIDATLAAHETPAAPASARRAGGTGRGTPDREGGAPPVSVQLAAEERVGDPGDRTCSTLPLVDTLAVDTRGAAIAETPGKIEQLHKLLSPKPRKIR